MKKILFTKMHNAGNDYIYVEVPENKINFPQELARKISHRRYGVGSDGLVLIDCKQKRVRMFNSDGSESAMCGNALFCVAKYLYEKKAVEEAEFSIGFHKKNYPVKIFAKAGQAETVEVSVEKPSLAMNDFLERKFLSTHLQKKKQFLEETFNFSVVSLTGSLVALQNPHFVVYVENLEKVPIEKWGAAIEKDKLFPQAINIEFVEKINSNEVQQRTWERGSGETWACGSGAVAVCTVGYLTKKTEEKLRVKLLGGKIDLHYQKDCVKMLGYPKTIFSGEFSL